MFNQSTAAKLADCKVASVRTLTDQDIIFRGPKGYTYDQLVLIRVIVLLRDALKVQKFYFAEMFNNQKIVLDTSTLIMFIDNKNLFVVKSDTFNDDWGLSKEVTRSDFDKESWELIRECFPKFVVENHTFITICIKNVCDYIDKVAENLGMKDELEKAKKESQVQKILVSA